MRHLEPLAGNPQTLEPLARRYKDVARYLDEAAVGLGRIANTAVFISDAVDATRAEALIAAEATRKIHTRYVGTADALVEYAVALEPIQREANAAIAVHDNAVSERARWRHKRDESLADSMRASGTEQEELVAQAQEYGRRADEAKQDALAAEARYDLAEEEYDRIALAAWQKIDDAVVASELNDGFWDNLGGAWEDIKNACVPILQVIHDVCSKLAEVMGYIALALSLLSCIIPFLAPLAAFANTLTLILVTVVAVSGLLLFVMGAMTLGELLVDGLTLALALLTKGATGRSPKVANWIEDVGNWGSNRVGTAIGGAFDTLAGVAPHVPHAGLVATGAPGILSTTLQADAGFLVDAGLQFGVDSLPFADVKFFADSESATGPLWTRPDSIEIPTLDAATFDIPDVVDIHFDSVQTSINAGEFRLQGFMAASR